MEKTIEKFHSAIAKLNASNKKTDTNLPTNSGSIDKSKLQQLEENTSTSLEALRGTTIINDPKSLQGNIENYIGMAQVPIGITGPLLIDGQYAQGSFQIPLATTEGALVASYARGAKAATLSGGVKTYYLAEGVQRSPVFIFDTCGEAITFQNWLQTQAVTFEKITAQKSRFAQLQKVDTLIEGNHLITTFHYSTGDAAGQNMVTICTQAICEYILENNPHKIKRWYLEGNHSGDKKATHNSLSEVRGRKVVAEVVIPKDIVASVLKSTPEAMADYSRAHLIASIQSGAIGAQGHFANALTALFLATGQDVACVAEAAIGISRMELTDNGDLYATVTLPNLIVGTVGGGTHLPTQAACLEILDCKGAGKARKFAEIAAAIVICGELSITAALSEGHFARAHQQLGRPSKHRD